MLPFIGRRLLASVPIVLALLTVNFFLIHAAPGDPADLLIGDDPDLDPAVVASTRARWGLDQPLLVQWLVYMRRVLLELDLGHSIRTGRSVTAMIAEALPATLLLSSVALAIQLGLGTALGVIGAARRGTRLDGALRVGALTLYSVPSFYLGILLIFTFAGGVFSILPASGRIDVVRHDSMTWLERAVDHAKHLALPALTLGLGSAAAISRYVRGEMIDALGQDYIRTARAKGLPERRVLLRHAMRSALLPLITVVGLSLPFLLSGSVIVENVFGWPGLGRVTVRAAFDRDYPVFLAANIGLALLVVAGNLAADVLYAIADPRIRVGRSRD